MQLTHENRGVRWLVMVIAWLIAALLIAAHTAAVREYVALLNGLGHSADAEPRTPLHQVIPARHADAQMWVRHSLAAAETNTLRVRVTDADNAPFGREVHWSSGFGWLLRGAAALQRTFTGEPAARSLERTLLWFNAPLLFAVIVLVSGWVAGRAGAGAGVLVVFAMLAHHRFYEGFAPTYVDHHGLANAAIFGVVVGVAFMGAGWWQWPGSGGPGLLPDSRERARGAVIFSAVCGALGLWLSAAAVLPAIAFAGAAGLAVTWWRGRGAREAGADFEPALWQLWGRVGAVLSFAFYLLEYAPAHFGLRLEVNHPLYALAWWAGAEFVALLAGWRVRGGEPFRRLAPRLVLPALGIAAPALVVLVGGASVFLVKDPFVGELRHFVAEGRSLPAAVRQHGVGAVGFELATTLLLVPATFLLRRKRGVAALVVGFLTVVTTAFVVMAFFEMRWWQAASGPQIALLLCLLSMALAASPRARRLALGIAVPLLVVLAIARIATARAENARHAVAAGDLLQPLYRDIAAVLRESQPEDDIVLLASPNASAGIGYYGRFKSLGTLYWENAPGLRGAAALFAAQTDTEAAALVRARHVTHIAMVPAANFVGEYLQLLAPHLTRVDQEKTFGFRLLSRHALPSWLQPIPYRPPPELKPPSGAVALFKIAFDQTDVERLYHTALAQLAGGDIARAEQSLADAFTHVPANARLALSQSAGMAFYDFGADAAAARIFQRVLELEFDPTSASLLAWILATSRDDRLRDGRTALALAERADRAQADDSSVLSSVAAAAAELGRFPEAVAAAERALALARAAGDRPVEPLLQQRLETYRAGQPWRQ